MQIDRRCGTERLFSLVFPQIRYIVSKLRKQLEFKNPQKKLENGVLYFIDLQNDENKRYSLPNGPTSATMPPQFSLHLASIVSKKQASRMNINKDPNFFIFLR